MLNTNCSLYSEGLWEELCCALSQIPCLVFALENVDSNTTRKFLPRSDEIGCVQGGMAVDGSFFSHSHNYHILTGPVTLSALTFLVLPIH